VRAVLGRQAANLQRIAEDPEGLERLTDELRKPRADAG
jgi:hypothetical protein